MVSFALNPHCWLNRGNAFCLPSNYWLCPLRICDKMWSCFIHFHSVVELRQALADTSTSLHFIQETYKRKKKKWINVDRKGWNWGFGAAVIIFGDWNRWCALLTSMKWKKIMLKYNIWDSNIKKNDTVTGSCVRVGSVCGCTQDEQRTAYHHNHAAVKLFPHCNYFCTHFCLSLKQQPTASCQTFAHPTCIWHHHRYQARCWLCAHAEFTR